MSFYVLVLIIHLLCCFGPCKLSIFVPAVRIPQLSDVVPDRSPRMRSHFLVQVARHLTPNPNPLFPYLTPFIFRFRPLPPPLPFPTPPSSPFVFCN